MSTNNTQNSINPNKLRALHQAMVTRNREAIKAAAASIPEDPNKTTTPAAAANLHDKNVDEHLLGNIPLNDSNSATGTIPGSQNNHVSATEGELERSEESSQSYENLTKAITDGLNNLGLLKGNDFFSGSIKTKQASENKEPDVKSEEKPEEKHEESEPTDAPEQSEVETKEAAQNPMDQVASALGQAVFEDAGVHEKLAAVGAIMLATEEGAREVQQRIEFHTGVKAASEFLDNLNQIKQANTQDMINNAQFQKVAASIKQAHAAIIDQLPTETLKLAYEQGVADADEMAAMEQAGTNEVDADISAEDLVTILGSMVQQGLISPQDAEGALLALEMEQGAELELMELEQELVELVQAGELDQQTAMAILNMAASGQMPEVAPAATESAAVAESSAAPEEVKQAAVNVANGVLNILA